MTQEAGRRIANLRFQGKAVADSDAFLAVTNSYRASGGGNFPGINAGKMVLSLPDSNQAVVADFLQHAGKLAASGQRDEQSWHFAKIKTAGPVYLRSAPGHLALAHEHGLSNVLDEEETDNAGFARYRLDFLK